MTRRTQVALGVMLALAPGVAAQKAQARLGLGASAIIPVGDFHAAAGGDGFNIGWQGMLLVDIAVPGRQVGWRVDGVYGENKANAQLKSDLASATGQPADAKMRMYGGDVDVLTKGSPKRAGRASTYLLGGVGVRRLSRIATSGGLTSDTSGTKFAWNVGGGVELSGRFSMFFLEARYVHVAKFSNFSTNHFPVTAGAHFGLSR